MDLSEITLKDLIDAIAEGVAEKLGGAAPKRGGPASETSPPDVDDGESDDAPTGDAPAEEVTPDDEDLVTEAQLKFVDENFEKKSVEEMRTELSDFYESYGDEPDEIAKEVAELKGKELTNAYKDYLARLVIHGDDGEIEDFLQDWEEPYRATRVYGGEEKFVWVKAGLTLTDDEASEAGLGSADPAEVEEEPTKKPPARTRKPKGRKK